MGGWGKSEDKMVVAVKAFFFNFKQLNQGCMCGKIHFVFIFSALSISLHKNLFCIKHRLLCSQLPNVFFKQTVAVANCSYIGGTISKLPLVA